MSNISTEGADDDVVALGSGRQRPIEGDALSDVVVEARAGAMWIRLNRPERRNAYDAAMAASIVDALDSAAEYRAVVITGSGGSFCAGGSLAALAAPSRAEMRGLYRSSLRLFDAVRNCPRPVV